MQRCSFCKLPVERTGGGTYPYIVWRHKDPVQDKWCSWGYPRR